MVDKNSALPNEAQPSSNATQPPAKTPPPPDKTPPPPDKTPPPPSKTPPPPQEGSAENPHDAFFKDILANIAHAKALMRYILPADIVASLDWNKMEPQKDTFITSAGRELRADALFKLPFKEAGKNDYVYLLVEHKSSQQPGINMQLRSYVTHIHNNQTGFHPVIPIVFYHGRAKWKRPSRLSDASPLPEKYRKVFMRFIPQTGAQDYLLFDALATELARLPSPLPKELPLALIGHIYHHVFQKIWRRPDEIGKNFSFLAQLFIIDEDMAEKIVYYLSNYHKMDRAVILERLNPEGKENAMLTYTEMKEGLIQEGMQKGIQKGMQKGIQKGMQKGIQKGMQKGRQEGIEEGVHNLARNMVTEGLAVETIVRITGLSEQEVQALN